MITTIVKIPLAEPIALEKAQQIFLTSAPKYQGVPGLIRKYYLLAEDGSIGGGVYLWDKRTSAEAFYTPEWAARIMASYGSLPQVSYFESPVIVDNIDQKIIGT